MVTVGSTVLCLLAVIWVAGAYILELEKYKFVDMRSFLVEQFGFRMIEISLSSLIIYSLRNHNYRRKSTVITDYIPREPLLKKNPEYIYT